MQRILFVLLAAAYAFAAPASAQQQAQRAPLDWFLGYDQFRGATLSPDGRHLAVIELAASLKLVLYVSLIACVFAPWGIAAPQAGPGAYALGAALYLGKLALGGFCLALFETAIAKMRVFRVPEFLGAAVMLGLLATLLRFVSGSL